MAVSTSFPYIFKYLWNKIFKTEKKKVSANLLHHPSFQQLNSYIAVKIPSIQFNDEARTEVFRDLLSIMILCYTDMMKKIVKESFDQHGDNTFESVEDFIQKLSNYEINVIQEYENKWKTAKIPDVCIEKFNTWHSKKRDMIFSDITTISLSPFHTTYQEKIAAFFDLIYVVLNMSVLDGSYVLKSLNGELTGQSYKGVEIGPEDDKCVIRTSDEDSDSKLPIPNYVKKKSELLDFKEEK